MKPLPNKKHVLNSIAEVAKQLGHSPSILEFAAHAEISRYSLFQLFPRWNDAVRAAGLKPCRLYVRPEDSELLRDWGGVVRKKRAIPSRWAYRLAGKYYPLTLAKRFGGWESVPQAFRNFAKGKREWGDVVALLPARTPQSRRGRPGKNQASGISSSKNHSLTYAIKPQGCRPALQPLADGMRHAALKDRALCGNPIQLREFRHEPVNEQGVVLLFGMLAKDLGFLIEAVQKGFPDCEAKRQIAPGRWLRVNIEFEYESKNFREHGHPTTGCDIIVCWRHNWDNCPEHIEVVELSTVIQSFASSED